MKSPDSNINFDQENVVKRYELPRQNEAAERLEYFRDTVKEFQIEHPEFLGATVFGSMVKGGEASADSDIDAHLFVDTENSNYKGEESVWYLEEFFKKLGVIDKTERKKYYDLFPHLLSSEIIDKNIKDEVDYLQKSEAYAKEREKMLNNYAEGFVSAEEFWKQEPEIPHLGSAIYGMFHARVGSGIEKYRKVFLKKLVDLPNKNYAERIWDDVSRGIHLFEKRKDHNIEFREPETLKDALTMYALEFVQQWKEKK